MRKIRKDFDAKGVVQSDHQISRVMTELMEKAIADVKAGTSAAGTTAKSGISWPLPPSPSPEAARRRNRFHRLVQPALSDRRRDPRPRRLCRGDPRRQHGLWDLSAILAGIAAVRQGGAAPVVRVPVGDFALVSRALDFGAEGIIAPMINTPRRARVRRGGQVPADRRAQLGAAPRDDARRPRRPVGLFARGQRSRDYARHDRDPHRA